MNECKFKIDGTVVVFFRNEGGNLFCKVERTEDVYYCGHRGLPETAEDAKKLLAEAWLW